MKTKTKHIHYPTDKDVHVRKKYGFLNLTSSVVEQDKWKGWMNIESHRHHHHAEPRMLTLMLLDEFTKYIQLIVNITGIRL